MLLSGGWGESILPPLYAEAMKLSTTGFQPRPPAYAHRMHQLIKEWILNEQWRSGWLRACGLLTSPVRVRRGCPGHPGALRPTSLSETIILRFELAK